MRSQFAFRTPSTVILTAPTSIGHLAVACSGGRLAATSIGHDSGPTAAARVARILDELLEAGERLSREQSADRELARDVLARLGSYLDGHPVDFDDVPLALEHLTQFQQRVIAACRAIACGATRSYGELAAAAGSPGAARAVGQVMAGNRMPIVVPCHRVLAAGGKLGGFSAPQGLSLKRRLLALESQGSDNEAAPAIRRPARPAARQRSFA
jgi:methylated-DNA-[protein]-cysteine S-methyltransferase